MFGAVLASIRSLRTSVVAFDTSVADLTGQLGDPVDMLFGTQLGGGTAATFEFAVQDKSPDLVAGTPEYEARAEKIREEIIAEKRHVLEIGGLFVLGTERHQDRRIDNQLRGRSGRQGDPGLSRFYLSLDDDLLRIFGPQSRLRAPHEQEP